MRKGLFSLKSSSPRCVVLSACVEWRIDGSQRSLLAVGVILMDVPKPIYGTGIPVLKYSMILGDPCVEFNKIQCTRYLLPCSTGAVIVMCSIVNSPLDAGVTNRNAEKGMLLWERAALRPFTRNQSC